MTYWFISEKDHRHRKLALIAFLIAFAVILLGAYTRLTNAGLSCPDWPHCYGYLTAPHTDSQLAQALMRYPAAPVDVKKAWTEMTHRYFAGTEGILIFVLACSLLINRKQNDDKTWFISVALIALLVVQVLLGMFTVTAKLKPLIVLSHLLTGLSILSVLWWLYLDLARPRFFTQHFTAALRPCLSLGLLILILQITLGGWVSTHYAGLACIDFPYCQGQLLPSIHLSHLDTDLITIHMLHRIGAFAVMTYLGCLSLWLLRMTPLRPWGMLLLSLVALQITLGILNVIWLRPVWLALIHQGAAIFLLLTLLTLIHALGGKNA